MHPIAKWIKIDETTFVKRVPNGMVMHMGEGSSWSAVFVPCSAELFAAFLEGNDVPLDELQPRVAVPPRIVPPS